jgi:hypothetical protein
MLAQQYAGIKHHYNGFETKQQLQRPMYPPKLIHGYRSSQQGKAPTPRHKDRGRAHCSAHTATLSIWAIFISTSTNSRSAHTIGFRGIVADGKGTNRCGRVDGRMLSSRSNAQSQAARTQSESVKVCKSNHKHTHTHTMRKHSMVPKENALGPTR